MSRPDEDENVTASVFTSVFVPVVEIVAFVNVA
jgi:hypothetical protein